jgi:hypothetical protein
MGNFYSQSHFLELQAKQQEEFKENSMNIYGIFYSLFMKLCAEINKETQKFKEDLEQPPKKISELQNLINFFSNSKRAQYLHTRLRIIHRNRKIILYYLQILGNNAKNRQKQPGEPRII